MKKKLPFYLSLLLGLCFATHLVAADFIISGKVSIVQASVPVPFYDVHISDGNGLYKATAKTTLNGTYSHTFDIPENDTVFFEVAIIDRCSGNPIIIGIKKPGDVATADFIMCLQGEGGGEEKECEADFDYIINGKEVQFIDNSKGNIHAWQWHFADGTTSEEASPTHTYLEDGTYYVTLTVEGDSCTGGSDKIINIKGDTKDCVCATVYDPVCVVTASGHTITMPNACAALCAGYTDFMDCENTNPIDSNCFCPEYYNPVCVLLEDSTLLTFSNECFANCEGYTDFFSCQDEEGFFDDCEALGLNFPVCVQVEAGEPISFESPCAALEAGYTWKELGICEGLDGASPLTCADINLNIPITVCITDSSGQEEKVLLCDALDDGYLLTEVDFCEGFGGLEGVSGLNCQLLGINLPVTVCVQDTTGTTLNLPFCNALDAGYSLGQIEFCDVGMDSLPYIDTINCAALGINIPVCVIDEEGDVIKYANPCDAIEAGHQLHQLSICDNQGLNCDVLGINIPFPVCVQAANGETIELMLCDALAQGYGLEDIEICEDILNTLDCEALGINIPVCTFDDEGNKITYNTPCDALNAGLGIAQLQPCNDSLDILDSLNCETLGITIPFSVCVLTASGETVELMICDALAQGYGLEDIELCEGTFDSLDCDALGINIPVCTIDPDGIKTTYETPCDALALGIEITELQFCNDSLGILDSLNCETLGITIPFSVCVLTASGATVELMICDALAQGYGLEDIELCEGTFDSLDCDALGIIIPVCTIDPDGIKTTYETPCDALAAGHSIHNITFCEDIPDFGEYECDSLDISLPFIICVKDENGILQEYELCELIEKDIHPNQIVFCDSTFNDLEGKDCEALGINIPVCVAGGDSSIIEYANPCAAIADGHNLESLTFCNGLKETIDEVFGVTDVEEKTPLIEAVTLFPNPVNRHLNLRLNFTKRTDYELRIQAINGNAIYRQKYQALNGENMLSLDVSSLHGGIYLAQILTNEGIKTIKFMKYSK